MATCVLGVDPGTRSMGYGFLSWTGGQKSTALTYGALQPKAKDALYVRLGYIHSQLNFLIQQHKPRVLVLEKSFCGNNVQTAISMGEARGVVLALAGYYGLELVEYTPTSVKSAIVGAGRATKEQMQKMVGMMLAIQVPFKTSDESDALALALTYIARSRSKHFADMIKKTPAQ